MALAQQRPLIALPELSLGQTVELNNISWAEYQQLRQAAPNAWRFTFDCGWLFIVSPSGPHEERAYNIGFLLGLLSTELNIDLYPLGATTLKIPNERGLEPDVSFSVGTQKEIPDLVVEVEQSRELTRKKRQIYHRLGIRELWVINRHGELSIYQRVELGWMLAEISEFIPVSIELLEDWLNESGSVRDLSRRVRQEFMSRAEGEATPTVEYHEPSE